MWPAELGRGYTALHVAALRCHEACTIRLLREIRDLSEPVSSAYLNQRNFAGETALHAAIRRPPASESCDWCRVPDNWLAIVRPLLEAGIEVDVAESVSGETALMRAAGVSIKGAQAGVAMRTAAIQVWGCPLMVLRRLHDRDWLIIKAFLQGR